METQPNFEYSNAPKQSERQAALQCIRVNPILEHELLVGFLTALLIHAASGEGDKDQDELKLGRDNTNRNYAQRRRTLAAILKFWQRLIDEKRIVRFERPLLDKLFVGESFVRQVRPDHSPLSKSDLYDLAQSLGVPRPDISMYRPAVFYTDSRNQEITVDLEQITTTEYRGNDEYFRHLVKREMATNGSGSIHGLVFHPENKKYSISNSSVHRDSEELVQNVQGCLRLSPARHVQDYNALCLAKRVAGFRTSTCYLEGVSGLLGSSNTVGAAQSSDIAMRIVSDDPSWYPAPVSPFQARPNCDPKTISNEPRDEIENWPAVSFQTHWYNMAAVYCRKAVKDAAIAQRWVPWVPRHLYTRDKFEGHWPRATADAGDPELNYFTRNCSPDELSNWLHPRTEGNTEIW